MFGHDGETNESYTEHMKRLKADISQNNFKISERERPNEGSATLADKETRLDTDDN